MAKGERYFTQYLVHSTFIWTYLIVNSTIAISYKTLFNRTMVELLPPLKNRQTVFAIGLIILYLILRLYRLDSLPIFNDESTYIRYGIHQLQEKDHTPYSLLIGKEPLMPFLYAITGDIIGDMLLGARLVTVLFGFLTSIGLYYLTKKLISEKAAFFAVFFYIIAPYTLFYDRLAVMDSAVSTVAIWSLLFTYRLIDSPNWKNSLVLGLVMSAGLWVKFSALFYLVLPMMSFGITFLTKKDVFSDESFVFKLFLLPLGIVFLMYLPLLSHPYYVTHTQLLGQYTYSFFSIFSFPISVWVRNFSSILQWTFFYLTPALFLLSIFSFGQQMFSKKFMPLVLWVVLPLLYEVLFAKLFTARHAVSVILPFFVFAGYGMDRLFIKNKVLAGVLFLVITVSGLSYATVLLTNPYNFPNFFPGRAKEDMGQYVGGFAAGYGVMEAIDYVNDKSLQEPILVVLRADHGNPEDAVVAFLANKKNITLILSNNLIEEMKKIDSEMPKDMKFYFISRGAYYAGLETYFKNEKRFYKPDGDFVGVQELKRKTAEI